MPSSSVPSFSDLLSRADEQVLQTLLSRSTMRLMQATRGQDLTIAEVRGALLEIKPPYRLLQDKQSLCLLLELLYPAELSALSLAVCEEDLPFAVLTDRLSSRPTLRQRLMVELSVAAPPVALPSTLPPTSVICRPTYGLFPHQRHAKRQALELLTRHPYRVMLHMPTGAGKTRTAMQIVAEHLRTVGAGTVVWLATTEELCDQAAEEFDKAWSYAGDREISLVRAWGGHRLNRADLISDSPKVIIASLAKLHASRSADQTLLAFIGSKVSLVVFDEAHQSIATTYREVVDVLLARGAKLLGLSATPGRSWRDVAADFELSEYFSQTKVALEVEGYPSPIDYLIGEGYLARPNFRRVEHHSAVALSDREREQLAEELDIPEGVRDRLAADDIRNVAIIKECQRLVGRHPRLLVFAATVAHADLLAVVLRGLKIDAYSITGGTPSAERSRLINWYRDGGSEPRVLTNFGVLTTGFDAPRTSAVLIARPTKSLVLFSQMAGRALRGVRAGGNASAEVVTVVDTSLPGFGSLESAFTNWEDVW
jgi:DNA repair protein RadD